MFGKNKKGALQHQIFLFIFIIFKSFRISHPKLQMQQCNIASVSTQQVRNSARRKLRWKCTVADVQKVWLVCSMKIFHKVTYGSLCLSTTCVHRVFNISLVTCFPPGPTNRHICNLNNLLQKQFRLCCFRCRFRSGFKSQKNKGLQLKPFHF